MAQQGIAELIRQSKETNIGACLFLLGLEQRDQWRREGDLVVSADDGVVIDVATGSIGFQDITEGGETRVVTYPAGTSHGAVVRVVTYPAGTSHGAVVAIAVALNRLRMELAE